MKKILFILSLNLISIIGLNAKHIVGGEITYKSTGDGKYHFTMHIYRDCSCFQCADFDNPAHIAVYKGSGNDYVFFQDKEVGITSGPIPVDPPFIPCTIPPNLCVEEATYEWDMTLPITTQTYQIVYQRCCRNQTITNINNPNSSGATYSIEIPPLAQSLQNNSPVFNAFPPTMICVGTSLYFNHSATDEDGDLLVYEFCSPLLGGGIAGGPDDPNGNPSSCIGVMPTVSCPPPYDPVSFISPLFSATNPLGGNPQITISSTNGLITGTPTIQGQYVVGVCVNEFRNGQLLGTVRRDFQFNVIDCGDIVVADIRADSLSLDRDFFVWSCGSKTVTLQNLSQKLEDIQDYHWQFEINGDTITYTDWEPTITFPDTGSYPGVLFLKGNLSGCDDTAYLTINIFPGIKADFSYVIDTCETTPIDFTDNSASEGGPIIEWLWNFDDGNLLLEENPSYAFSSPGIYDVKLRVRDGNQCKDDTIQRIYWFPVPPIAINLDNYSGCTNDTFHFNNLTAPIDTSYDFLWTFDDGTTSTEQSPSHVYNTPGTYQVKLEITSPTGCYKSKELDNNISIKQAPIADFTYSPDKITNIQPEVQFTDQSLYAFKWWWDFGDGGSSFTQNPLHVYQDTGTQVITLIVSHPSGCRDTTFKIIDIEPTVIYSLPNAFTPNADGLNDGFLGKGFFEGMKNFSMTIWNRWGELVFETNDPNEAWNGKKNNVGELSPLGVYVYVVHYETPRGEVFDLKGFATLVK